MPYLLRSTTRTFTFIESKNHCDTITDSLRLAFPFDRLFLASWPFWRSAGLPDDGEVRWGGAPK